MATLPLSEEERQGKMLLHTEHNLLTLLEDQEGVVHHHGMYKVKRHWSLTHLRFISMYIYYNNEKTRDFSCSFCSTVY